MRYSFILFYFLCFLSFSCNSNKKSVIKTFYENGKVKSEIQLVGDKYHGITKYYYPNGKLRLVIPFKHDKINGKSSEYYENGSLKVTKTIKDDVLHGWLIAYFDNGQVELKTKYFNGEPEYSLAYTTSGDTLSFYKEGKAIRYFSTGSIEQIICSQNKDEIKVIQFNEEGNIIKYSGPISCLSNEDSLKLTKLYPGWQKRIYK